VLYTDVDGQCDKLVTDEGHQFTTLTVHLSWQHLRRSAVPEIWLVPGAHQNLSSSRDLTTPLSGMVCRSWASTCYRQPTYQIWSLYLSSLTMRIWSAIQNVRNMIVWG